jgi:hypothetical protein
MAMPNHAQATQARHFPFTPPPAAPRSRPGFTLGLGWLHEVGQPSTLDSKFKRIIFQQEDRVDGGSYSWKAE